MCLNRARQRRRHRRAIEDWAFLHQHALNAEASPDFAAWLRGSGWAWQGEQAAPVRSHPGCPLSHARPLDTAWGFSTCTNAIRSVNSWLCCWPHLST